MDGSNPNASFQQYSNKTFVFGNVNEGKLSSGLIGSLKRSMDRLLIGTFGILASSVYNCTVP